MNFPLKEFLLLFLTLSFCDGRGIDIGLCDATTFACKCGTTGFTLHIPIKQCTYIYQWKKSCRPCDNMKEDKVCPKYLQCQECKIGIDQCVSCPPGKYGLWCNGVCQCQNGGICSPSDGKCTCLNGFEGGFCEIKKGCPQQNALPPVIEVFQPPETPFLITYSCPEGYYLKGLQRATCLPNGQWSNPPPECLKICPTLPSPENGRVTFTSEMTIEGSSAVFACDEPYVLIGEPALSCQRDGMWNSNTPSCQHLKFCEDPGYIKFGKRNVQTSLSRAGSFVEETVIQYSCQDGFLLMGYSSLTCLKNSSWTSTIPVCIKVADSDVNCSTSGAAVVSDVGVPVRIQCPYKCAEINTPVWGTALYKDTSSVCVAALHAGKITNLGGPVHIINNGPYENFIGSEINGVTTFGFQDSAESFRFGHIPSVLNPWGIDRKACPSGWFQVDDYCVYVTTKEKAWDKTRAICNNLGSLLPSLDDENLKKSLSNIMQEKGVQEVWTSLRRVVHAEITTFSWETDDEIYNVYPNDTIWDENEPSDNGDCVSFISKKVGTSMFQVADCSEQKTFACVMNLNDHFIARCDDPGNLENGYYKTQGEIANVFYGGSSVIFHCNPLYYLKGSSNITCSSNGTWNGILPACIRVPSCKSPPTPAYGFVDFLPPAQARMAQPSASWGSRIPRLPIGLNAPLPPGASSRTTLQEERDPTTNVTYPEGYYKIGSRAVYSCSSRYYQLVGSETRRCQSDELWSGRSPTCIPICGQTDSPRAPFIVNGNATDKGQWPWQVAISRWIPDYRLWFLLCGGSLLNEHWLVTAAHCVTYASTAIVIDPSEFRIYLGKYNRDDKIDDEYVQIRGVDEIHVHPDYSPAQYDADIALIQLDSPVELTTRIQPVCLPTDRSTRENLVEGRLGVVTGWGMNENKSYSETLQQAVLPVVSHKTCEEGYKMENQPLSVTENMFCAGYKEGKSDACSGDSGGPVVFLDDSSKERRWILEGIVSWGSPSGCGNPNQYGGFTKVNKFIQWIKEYV